MKMKLAAAAVAAALVAPVAAQADVTVYGLAQLELAQVKTDASEVANGVGVGNINPSQSVNAVADYKNSRFGMRFTEDLGDGLKANGEFEFGPNLLDAAYKTSTTNNDSGQYARQQWLGLSGGWGEFQIGTLLQPYKYSGGVKYDAFVATGLESRTNNGGMLSSAFGQGAYFANAIAYKNTFGGVQVWLAYSPEKNGDFTAAATNATTAAATQVSKYNGSKGDTMASLVMPFPNGEVGIAYAKDKSYNVDDTTMNGTTTGSTATITDGGKAGEKNTKIFGKYSFGPSTILAQYEKQKASEKLGADFDEKVTFVAYQFKMGANTFVAQLGKEKTNSTDITVQGTKDIKYTALGVIHGFSKNTSGFLGYRKSDYSDHLTVSTTASTTTPAVKVISAGLSIKF